MCGALVCVRRESDGWSARGQAHAQTRMLNVPCDPSDSELADCHGFTRDVLAPSGSKVSLVTAADTISVQDQDIVKTRASRAQGQTKTLYSTQIKK